MVKPVSSYSSAQTSSLDTKPQKKYNFRKAFIITVIVLEVFLFLGSLGFGVAAIASGIHLLWVGVIPCALAMIGLAGSLMCLVRQSRRNNRTFQRLPQNPIPKAYLKTDHPSGVFKPSIPRWR